jgi:hypothetical protein
MSITFEDTYQPLLIKVIYEGDVRQIINDIGGDSMNVTLSDEGNTQQLLNGACKKGTQKQTINLMKSSILEEASIFGRVMSVDVVG